MTSDVFEKRLALLSAEDDAEIERLAREYWADVRESLTAAIQYVKAGTDLAPQALNVLQQVQETASGTLAASLSNAKPAAPAWMFLELTKSLATLEETAAKRLRTALADTRRIEPPKNTKVEDPEPPFRICDEAYLGLRRILHSESQLQFSLESKHFLDLTDSQKSEEIARYLETGGFTQYLENPDD